MKIASSSLQLTASHSYLQQSRQRESLRLWQDGADGRRELSLQSEQQQLRGSAETVSQLPLRQPATVRPSIPAAASPPTAAPKDVTPADEVKASPTVDPKISVLIMLIERLTGRKVELLDPAELEGKVDDTKLKELAARQVHAGSNGQREGWGMVYQRHEYYQESETTTFNATGTVRTADGREIAFAVELRMSREFASTNSVTLRAGDALKDPLVINFDGNSAQLGDTNFVFDLDADGSSDRIAFVGSGSGFLALDRNNDGQINNGRELFGPTSGDGFAELARYDDDSNGWIDEGDAVFSKLRIWNRGENGLTQLDTLAERNVGAISIDRIATPFQIKDNSNDLLGSIRSSGLYLGDDGRAGTVQQLDLVV